MSFGMFITCIVLVSASVIFSVVPIIIGKLRLKRATRPVEYYPPRGYSPVDVLQKYYGKAADAHDLFNPIMLYWAECGYITIEEDCKRGLKITRLKNPEFNKKRDYGEASELDNYKLEKDLFYSIFAGGDVFYTLTAHERHKDNFTKFMDDAQKGAREVSASRQDPLTKKLTIATCIIAMAVLIAITIAAGIDLGPMTMVMIFPIVGVVMSKFAVPAMTKEDRKFKPLIVLFFAVWSATPFIAVIYSATTEYIIVLALAALSAAFTMHVTSPRIDIRTQSDAAIYGRIDSFKRFLVEAELDKLETLVEEDPDYFYDVLPYCYVLKITEKMKPKFDRIDMDGPSWYLGDLRDTLMF